MLLRLIEDGKPEIFQQQIYDLPVISARMDYYIAANRTTEMATYFPMQSIRLLDSQFVTNLWFKYGSNFSKFFRILEIE